MKNRTLQGTWEEISVFADKWAGHQLRVTILDTPDIETVSGNDTLNYASWREQADALAAHLATIWPSNVSAVDAVNEQRR